MTNPSLDLAFEWLQNSEKKCDMDQEKWMRMKLRIKQKGLLIMFLPKDWILFEPLFYEIPHLDKIFESLRYFYRDIFLKFECKVTYDMHYIYGFSDVFK